jgi:antitoxin component of RelBE/YafQ-DinJ toxin-antitoxin module
MNSTRTDADAMLQVRIGQPLKDAARALAQQHQRTLSQEVRFLLARELEESEPTRAKS